MGVDFLGRKGIAMRIFIPLFAAVTLSGCMSAGASAEFEAARAEKEEAALTKALRGRVASGEAKSCINMRDIRSQKVVGRSTVIYEMGGNLAYRNDFGGGCVGLDERDAMITQTPTNQLCRGDIARVADLTAGIETGSCVFGDFVPYRKPS